MSNEEEPKPFITMNIDGTEFMPINEHTERKLVRPLSGRMFRDAYKTPDDENVIRLHMDKVGDIVHNLRRVWRLWKEQQPIEYEGDMFDCDEKSLLRIERMNGMAEKGLPLPKTFTSANSKEHKITPEWIQGLYAKIIQQSFTAHEESKKFKITINKHVKGKKEMLLKKLAEKFEKDMEKTP